MQETEETHVRSLGRKDPLKEEMATPSSILAGKSHGQGGLEGYGHRVAQPDTTDVTWHTAPV